MRRASLAAVLGLALTLTACGEESVSRETIAQAARDAAAQGTARISFRMSAQLGEQAGGGRILSEGEGEIDIASQSSHLSMTFTGEGGQADKVGDLMGEMEAIYRDTTIYMKWPFLTQLMPDPTPWIKVDLQVLGEQMGIDFAQLLQFSQNNPAQGLDYLRGIDDVEEVGAGSIRGVETVHYSGVVDLERLSDDVPQSVRSQLEKISEISGIERVPADVWLDQRGLPRRVAYVFDYSPAEDAPPGTPSGRMTMQMEFYDYGADVGIVAPPEHRVTNFAELVGAGN
ncbi:MAG: hypothetical protein ACRDJJ_01970 [Actinomycetota bacterium]